MPRFTFKLAGVLEHRKQIERQRQREVAAAQQKLLAVQAELDALIAVKRASSAQLRGGHLSAALLAAHQRFAAAMRQKSAALSGQLGSARRELDAAQLVLVEAARQRKIMEKLREREQERWTTAQQKTESAEADEIARQAHSPSW